MTIFELSNTSQGLMYGNTDVYKEKITKHMSNDNAQKVALYLAMYLSIFSWSKGIVNSTFPGAVKFLKDNGWKCIPDGNNLTIVEVSTNKGYSSTYPDTKWIEDLLCI